MISEDLYRYDIKSSAILNLPKIKGHASQEISPRASFYLPVLQKKKLNLLKLKNLCKLYEKEQRMGLINSK